MKAILCEVCGSNDLVKQNGVFVCQHCGTKYSLDEVKKLYVEVGGSVKIDTSEEVKNLFTLARRAKNDKNYASAEKYYSELLLKVPSSWEANFYSTYFHCMNCKVAEIYASAVQLKDFQESIFVLVKDNVKDEEERSKVLEEIGVSIYMISDFLFNASISNFNGTDYSIRSEFRNELTANCLASTEILFACGDCLEKFFADKHIDDAVYLWECGIEKLAYLVKNFYFVDKRLVSGFIEIYKNKIMQYDSSYKVPDTKMSGDSKAELAVNLVSSVVKLFSAFK